MNSASSSWKWDYERSDSATDTNLSSLFSLIPPSDPRGPRTNLTGERARQFSDEALASAWSPHLTKKDSEASSDPPLKTDAAFQGIVAKAVDAQVQSVASEKDAESNIADKKGFLVNPGDIKDNYRPYEWRMYTYFMNLFWADGSPEVGPLAGWYKDWSKESQKGNDNQLPWAALVDKIRKWLMSDEESLPDCFNENLAGSEQWQFLDDIATGSDQTQDCW